MAKASWDSVLLRLPGRPIAVRKVSYTDAWNRSEDPRFQFVAGFCTDAGLTEVFILVAE